MSVSLCYPSQQEQPFFDDFFADSWRDAGRDAPRGMRSMTCCAMAWKASVTLTSALADASMKRTSYSAASAWPSCVDTCLALWLSLLLPTRTLLTCARVRLAVMA